MLMSKEYRKKVFGKQWFGAPILISFFVKLDPKMARILKNLQRKFGLYLT